MLNGSFFFTLNCCPKIPLHSSRSYYARVEDGVTTLFVNFYRFHEPLSILLFFCFVSNHENGGMRLMMMIRGNLMSEPDANGNAHLRLGIILWILDIVYPGQTWTFYFPKLYPFESKRFLIEGDSARRGRIPASHNLFINWKTNLRLLST